ncbi:MAG: DegV family protein [Coprothermobacter proteolyticus]
MFHIVIDSAIDHLQDYPSFTVIPLYLRIGEKFLKDRVEITRDKFYSIMSSVIDTFTTSQPSPEDFKQVFQSIPEQDILVLTVASSLSGTMQSALAAARETTKNVKVLDILNASIASGLLAHIAVQLREQGKTIEETYEELMQIREKISLVAVIATLKNLVRLGRLPAIAGWVGGLLKTVPFIRIKGGEIKPLKNERGTPFTIFKKNVDKIMNLVDPRYPIAMAYTDLSGDIVQYAQEKGAYLVQVSPIVGAFAGNNAYGFAFVEGGNL